MKHLSLEEPLEISVEARFELDELLDRAVGRLIPEAKARRVGIAVTRRETGRYEVALCQDVPCGITRQYW